MNTNIHQQTAAVDYLSLRLRRIVRTLIERERTAQSSSWSAFFGSKQYPLATKILRSLALITCVAMFLMQVYDRAAYYLTSPINTDVLIKQNNDEPYPEMTICHDPINTTKLLYAELGIPEDDSYDLAVFAVTYSGRKFNLEEIWRKIKASDDIVSAKIIGNSLSENLTYSHVLMPQGNCVTFQRNSTSPIRKKDGKFEIIFTYEDTKFTKNRIDFLYLHERKEHPMSRYEHEPVPGYKTIVRMAVTKYNFQYRNGQPCVSSSEHRKCVHECFTKHSMKEGGCRFPFQPTEAKLPACQTGNTHQMRMYLIGNTEDNCTCTRKCSYRIFDSSSEGVEKFVNQTVYLLDFGTSHITLINERFVYTAVNLLADIGGNSGLWIGLSALSVFYILPSRRRPKKKPHYFSATDPLYRIVLKRFRRETKKMNSNPIAGINQSCKIIKSFFLGSVFLLFAYAVYNRIDKYFQYPVRTLVDITFMQTIQSASVTICPGDTDVESLQKQYAKLNNISDFCEVKKWQLLDMPQVNASILWTTYDNSIGKIDWVESFKPEYLYDGVCFNVFHKMKPVNAKSKNFVVSYYPTLCGENYVKVFIKPSTGYYDYFLYRYLMFYKKQSISYVLKRIAADEDEKDCVTETDHESCEASCLTRKLWDKINCWLPFMPPSNLSLCNSPISAKNSLETYLELFVLRKGSADCKCLPPCYTQIYETAVEGEPWPFARVTFGFGTRHNIMETYRKVRAYSVVTLLCDIGCWLGSMLGFCVFGLVDTLLSAANKLKRRQLQGIKNQK